MYLGWKICLSVFGIILVAAFVFILYLALSPMPVVRLLRRGLPDSLSTPDGYDELKSKINIQKDMEYKSKYKKNTYDLYLPNKEEPAPLVLWVHGGSFVAGDKNGIENWGVMLANNGYAVAAINYEWAPEASYPAQITQICEAFTAISERAKENNIDMSRITIAGDSAGAHMASQFALVHTNPEFAKRLHLKSPLAEGALKCALLYCGPYDLKTFLDYKKRIIKFFVSRIGWSYVGKRGWLKSPLADTLTPMNFVNDKFVPCYITDGNHNSFESHGKTLGDTLRKCGVCVEERYFPIEDGEVNHDYQMELADENARLCFADTLCFLKKHTGV